MNAYCNGLVSRLRTVCLLLILLGGRFFMPVCLSQACNSANLAAFATSPIQFTTYSSLVNGATAIQYISAQINTYQAGICPNWRMTVRASSNFNNGSKELDLRYVSIQFNTVVGGPTGSQIGIPANRFILSTNETTIIPRSDVPIDVTRYQTYQIKYDMIIEGGNHMLALSNGEYQTNLIFTLYDQNGNMFSTSTTRVVFQVYYSGNDNSRVELQNGASNVMLQFTAANSVANGVTVDIPNGLSVTSFASHQILAKAASNRLISGESASFLPISIIQLTLSVSGPFGQISCFSVPLSVTGQVVADNPMTDYTYQNVFYNLRFAIAGNDPNIVGADPGNYMSSMVFSLVPK
jgi:hypothetical protein